MAGKRGNPNLAKKDQVNSDVQTSENNEIKIEIKSNEKVSVTKSKIKQKPVWQADLHRMICVKNISRGKLVYKSKRQMGYIIEWKESEDENYIELIELVNLKNTDLRFITEPWIRIVEDDEVEILKYLGVYKYFEKILDIENIESVLELSPDKFERKFKNLPDSYREAIAERAAKMIKTGELDSLRIKNIIEKEMDIDLGLYARGE